MRKNKIIETNNTVKIQAILCYIPLLCFLPILKYSQIDEFSKKHVKQGFLLLIVECISLLFLIDIVSKIFWTIILILCFIASCAGIIVALSKKEWKIPIIGIIFEKYEI